MSDPVYSVAVQADGRILLGGEFTAVGGIARNYIARVDAAGTLDAGFNPNANNSVFSAVVQADGGILLGGSFTTVGGIARNKFARLLNDAATQTLSAPDATQAIWIRGGSSPEVAQVTFEKSNDSGATWTALGSGTRIGNTPNWQLTGLTLAGTGQLRARGRTSGGDNNSSSGLVEGTASYSFADTIPPDTMITSSTPAVNSTTATITFTGTDNVAVTGFEGSLDGASYATVTSPASLSGLAQGEHTYSVRAMDAVGNVDATPATVSWTVDTVAPTISGTFTPFTVFAGVLPDYRSQAVKSDSVGVTSVTQSPAQGSAVTAGAVLVTLTAHDAAGNTENVTFTVIVRPLAAVTTTQFAQGATAPGAGTNGLAADAKLASFGPPATDDAGDVAFVAKWKGATGKGTGLFLNDKCLGIVGGSAPIAGAKYVSFTDPVVEGGKVVCIAKLSTGASAVVSNFSGAELEKIALTGAVSVDAGGAKFKSFKAVALRGGSLGFLGQLTGGTGANKVTADNDRAEWVREPGAALHLVYRDGFDLGNLAFVASFTSFQPGIGSPGQGRGWLSHNQQGLVLTLNTLTDKTSAFVFGGYGGDIFLARTGVVGTHFAPALAGASFASFHYPAMNDALQNTFYATMKVGAGGVTKANAGGIFLGSADFSSNLAPYALIARIGTASGVLGANFSTLGDPVLSPDGGVAFTATLKGGTAKGLATKTLWWKPAGQSLALLAQGGQRPGLDLPALAQWSAFDSLAITDRGPLFAATLVAGKGGVTAKTATGVWACDFTGAPRVLFCTGDTISGKVLAKFTLLKVTVGNAGVTRSFNNTAQVVWLATFTDKTSAIITTDVP